MYQTLRRSIARAERRLRAICRNTLSALLGRGQSLMVEEKKKKPLMQLLELRCDTVSHLAAQVRLVSSVWRWQSTPSD